MDEIWKPVKGYEGLYQVSNLARVRSLDRSRTVRDAYGGYMTRTDKGKIVSQTDNGHGYLIVQLRKDGHRKNHYVHRVVAEAFCNNPEDKPDVNHKDYNIKNNLPENLEWVTTKENICYSKHRMRHPKEHSRLGRTKEKYISLQNRRGKKKYRVSIDQISVCKEFDTLADAVSFRNEVMQVWRISAFCAEEMA